jgi:hypothetical protein
MMRKERHSFETVPPTSGHFKKILLFVMATVFIFCAPCPAKSASNPAHGNALPNDADVLRIRTSAGLMAANDRNNRPSNTGDNLKKNEEENAIEKNLELWQSLPSDQKKELRERMNQWQDLTPEQKDTYRQRYQKLQELTPGQRKKVEDSLDIWEDLSPTEQDEVRNLFKE